MKSAENKKHVVLLYIDNDGGVYKKIKMNVLIN